MTTKRYLKLSWAVALVLTALLVVFPIAELPTIGLEVATPLAWAEVAVFNGFYLWKSKNENRAKYAQRFIRDFAREYDTETALRLAEIVLRD